MRSDIRLTPRRTGAAAVSLALALSLVLAGCTGDNGTPDTPSGAATSTAAPVDLDSPLHPVVPEDFTMATVGVETVRVADEMQKLIPASDIVYIDAHDQEKPAEGEIPADYGVLRTITLDPEVDPLAVANTIVTALVAAGWILGETTTDDGASYVPLKSDASDDAAWIAFIEGDPSVEGQSVVSLRLLSPYLPAE